MGPVSTVRVEQAAPPPPPPARVILDLSMSEAERLATILYSKEGSEFNYIPDGQFGQPQLYETLSTQLERAGVKRAPRRYA